MVIWGWKSLQRARTRCIRTQLPGTYTVTLTAINSAGSNTVSQTGYITVRAAVPVSSFTANVTSGVKPLTVQFTDTSTNAPTGWYWTFGDGGVSTNQNPVYTFSSGGTYAVSLGVSNTAGSNTTTMPRVHHGNK